MLNKKRQKLNGEKKFFVTIVIAFVSFVLMDLFLPYILLILLT